MKQPANQCVFIASTSAISTHSLECALSTPAWLSDKHNFMREFSPSSHSPVDIIQGCRNSSQTSRKQVGKADLHLAAIAGG